MSSSQNIQFFDNLFATDYNKNDQMSLWNTHLPVCLIKELIIYLKLPLTSYLWFISLHLIIKTIDIKNMVYLINRKTSGCKDIGLEKQKVISSFKADLSDIFNSLVSLSYVGYLNCLRITVWPLIGCFVISFEREGIL